MVASDPGVAGAGGEEVSWLPGDYVRIGGEGERLVVHYMLGVIAVCGRPGECSHLMAEADTLEWAPYNKPGEHLMRCEVEWVGGFSEPWNE